MHALSRRLAFADALLKLCLYIFIGFLWATYRSKFQTEKAEFTYPTTPTRALSFIMNHKLALVLALSASSQALQKPRHRRALWMRGGDTLTNVSYPRPDSFVRIATPRAVASDEHVPST